MPKRFRAFLSFANPDKALAEAMYHLFHLLGHRTFYAPIELPGVEIGSAEWRSSIVQAIKDSDVFIPIYSRRSVHRTWVIYESAVADSNDIPRVPVKTSSIATSAIEDLPSRRDFIFDLSDEGQLRKLFEQVCGRAVSTTGSACDHAVAVALTKERLSSEDGNALVKKILTLSRSRWVFVAGNTPSNEARLREEVPWFTTLDAYKDNLRKFVESLTEKLVKEQFSIMACPPVESVGLHVVNRAAELHARQGSDKTFDYEIGGIYPFNTDLSNIRLSTHALTRWKKHTLAFRRMYLASQEWLVLIGGNQGTRDEFEAAKDCDTKIFPVPCFGGTALKVFNELKGERPFPCSGCSHAGCEFEAQCIDKIVNYLKSNID